MRKIKEILRLALECGLSHRQIARSLSVSIGSINNYLFLAKEAQLGWPLPADMDDVALQERLFPRGEPREVKEAREPDWGWVQRELAKKGVTLMLLWQEYRALEPQGYCYSRFCQRYRTWHKARDLPMRQEHVAGEKLFVDFAGQTVPIRDDATGTEYPAQIFVAVLGASSYAYVEALADQSLPQWVAAHIRAFEFLGGVPALLVPDNLRAAVTRACRYEPDLNPTYYELASHYGTAIMPARARKPRDKAKVEAGVQLVERWILARLRHHTFLTLADLNAAIAALLPDLNNRPFQQRGDSRRSLFDALDRPALRPLPATRFAFGEWLKARVRLDYHVEVEQHFYSVPHRLVQQPIEVRLTDTTVEVLHAGKRVASHRRSFAAGQSTTVDEHMPNAHRRYKAWTPLRVVEEAARYGPATVAFVETVLQQFPHPEIGFRSCMGVLSLGKKYGASRLEAACLRATQLQAWSFTSLKSILKTGLDQRPIPEPPPPRVPVVHPNLRGATYYQQPQDPAIPRP